MTLIRCLTLFSLSSSFCLLHAQSLPDRISRDAQGNRIIAPLQETGAFANPWPQAWEQEFRARREKAIVPFKGAANTRTTGEHEKWGYPDNIGAWLAGDQQAAVSGLSAPDLQASQDHAHTSGIDLYWCFTLKGQVRKWFDFNDQFTEAYQQKFRNAMKQWTEEDPRISLELPGLLGSGSKELDAYLLEELKKMWRDTDSLLAMADQAEAEGHQNKKNFARYIRANAQKIGGSFPGEDKEAWMAWWKAIADGDWMIFEEYERRTNPHPHPKYGVGSGPVGGAWDPKTRGMRADARNTDNLRGMRETAVYLFAEQSGNEIIRQLYKARIRRTAFSFWNVGNGEWDSSTYLGHTMSAYINLYDFAEDPEVRGYAKAIMDFLFTASAVKYRRGAWGGPQVRDYGDHGMWSTSAHTVWLYFGGEAKAPHHKELEHSLFFTSDYRPPAAVTAFARKEFQTPLEIFASHPTYQNFLPGQDQAPEYHETTYYGKHFQLGTMKEGHGYNRNGFKLLADHPQHGVAFVIPTTGKLRNGVTNTAGGDIVLQNGSAALYWNSKGGGVPYHVAMPKGIPVSEANGIQFLDLGKSWAALHPLELRWSGVTDMKGNKKTKGKARQNLQGQGRGFIMEVGDAQSHPNFDAFKKAVLAKSKVQLEGGVVKARMQDGRALMFDSSTRSFSRDGEVQGVDWKSPERMALWQPAQGGDTPISLGWKERRLVVEAGGHRFEAELKEDGSYVFKNILGE